MNPNATPQPAILGSSPFITPGYHTPEEVTLAPADFSAAESSPRLETRVFNIDKFKSDHNLHTRDELMQALRYRYGIASSITTLASTELQSNDPELLEYVDREMAWYFDDLGNCFMDCWDGVRHAIENAAALATKPTTGDLYQKFSGLPCIVLGAGPGASEHWDAIKASRGHAILIVCDVMLEPCLARGIVPDFVSAIERTPEVFDALKTTPTDGTTLLAPAVVEKRVIDHFGGRIIWCWRGCGLEKWIDRTIPQNNFGRSCGVQGVSVALLAGCSPIYLVGHDLCMTGELTHAAEAQASTLDTTAKIHADLDEYHQRVPAKSMNGRDVQTTHLWSMFRSDLEYIIREHKEATVINTGDGLAIPGTFRGEIPARFDQPITIPFIERNKVGLDRAMLIPLMLEDIPKIKAKCSEVIAAERPTPADLRLTDMVGETTAQAWTEIYHGTYTGALLRMHVQPLTPERHIVMLKRVANTVIKTLSIIEEGLHAIKNP